MMNRLSLSLAITDCDHVRDLVDGKVDAQGLSLVVSELPIEEILFRMSQLREWDAAEFSMGLYVASLGQPQPPFTAIPVFPSRMFRHSAIYIRTDSGIREPAHLAGRRVGIPEWAQGAGIHVRGYLQHQCALSLASIKWFQAGLNQPGRIEKFPLNLPAGLQIVPIRDRSLNDLLLAGELDAIISAREPDALLHGDPRVGRLFPDYREVEEAYYKSTGIFPIMHTVVVKRAVLERHPWVAMNLFKAFEEAKSRSIARATQTVAPRFPIPWCNYHAERAKEIFGSDYWPYGIESNRTSLKAFLGYCHEQGLIQRRLTVDELFPAELRASVRV